MTLLKWDGESITVAPNYYNCSITLLSLFPQKIIITVAPSYYYYYTNFILQRFIIRF